MNKKWEIYNVNKKQVNEISLKYGVSELLATVLCNRNIDEEDLSIFLNPTRHDFFDPFLMPDMEIAVERILKAIELKEKVIIYGDYDVDGITSTTVLKKFLKEHGLDVGYYIPNRLDEGYGLNKDAISKIKEDGYKLIITVDCGISGIDEVDFANSIGLEVIITDHHEQLDIIPNSLAIVDAKRKESNYPFRNLAGVGVVFKLIQALSIKLKLDEKEYLKYLDIVAIGTISDIVPLVSENRVITKLGLKLIEQTKNIGLKVLLNSLQLKHIDSYSIAFRIAPRINACGRLGYEQEAIKLFLTDNINEANKIVNNLSRYNNERQEIEAKIYKEAILDLEKEDINNQNAIVIGKEKWHHGIIGIVASKISEKYFKPTILVCFEGDLGKGSGRSIPCFDLHEALSHQEKYLEQYGGHALAIGLSLRKENFENFKNDFLEYANGNIAIKEYVPSIKIDGALSKENINYKFLEELKMLEPYGEENKAPIFIYKNIKINSIRTLSEGKHLKLNIRDDNLYIDAIGFGLGDLADDYLIGDKVDVVGKLILNEFNGYKNLQLEIVDIRKSI